ncbi:MAG: hypothetical protein ABR592_08620 [Nitriliruptorales bacterium]
MRTADRVGMSPVADGTRRLPPGVGAAQWALRVGLAFVVLGLAVAMLSGHDGADRDVVAGAAGDHVTVAPGQTLWDIAVAHTPPGSDPRAYLLQLREANGLDGRPVPAWTVVLLPRPDLPG